MKLSPVVLKLRLGNISAFGDRIAGSADLATALSATLTDEMAFVVQLTESAPGNKQSNSVNQLIDERFVVIVALKNDNSQSDKTGIAAYDRLFTIRAEIFSSILNWTIPGQESITSYVTGRLLSLNRAWLWYQYEFSSSVRIGPDDGFDNGADNLPNFNQLYAEWIISPNANLPFAGGLPIDDTDKTDMVSNVDFTVNLNAGGFGSGFGSGFKVVKI